MYRRILRRADEADLARIEQETLAATLETAYQDPDFRAFADLYDRGRTDNTAGDAILDLYHFTRALPHPAASLAALCRNVAAGRPAEGYALGQRTAGHCAGPRTGCQNAAGKRRSHCGRDEAADGPTPPSCRTTPARVKNLCYYLKEGDWDKSLAALDAVLTGWRRAGSVKGGKDANQCASAGVPAAGPCQGPDDEPAKGRAALHGGGVRRRPPPRRAAGGRAGAGDPGVCRQLLCGQVQPKRCWTTRIMST